MKNFKKAVKKVKSKAEIEEELRKEQERQKQQAKQEAQQPQVKPTKSVALEYVGKSVEQLFAVIGAPVSKRYGASCLGTGGSCVNIVGLNEETF